MNDVDEAPLPEINQEYLLGILLALLEIPSPTGYTDRVVHRVGEELESLGVPFSLTRRGAVRVVLKGREPSPARAIMSHLDTLGAIVKNLKPNGRLELVPIGTWSARFVEGARVTIFTDTGSKRGTVLPLKASGHTYDREIDTQPVSWDNVEVRTDDFCASVAALESEGYGVGDFVALDPKTELYNGFINSRYLDDNAGVACMLTAIKMLRETNTSLPFDLHMLFTISEEVGTGASTVLHGDIAELLAVDNATPAPGQNSQERSVTIAMADSSGPFDYHLTRRLIELCKRHGIAYHRDVFKYYRSDTASAVEAGNDIRFALVGFGTDASHGYERTHTEGLLGLTQLLIAYARSGLTFKRDQRVFGPLQGFPIQPE